MTAVFGFGGVKADEKRVTINPRLCKKWKRLQFNLVYKGDQFEVTITKQNVAITAIKSNRSKQTFVVAGKSVDCTSGKSALVKYR